MNLDTCIEILIEEVGGTISGIPPGATTVAKLLFGSIGDENTAIDVVDSEDPRSTYGYGLPENLNHANPHRTVGHSPGMVYRSAVAIVSRIVAKESEILYTRTQREQLAQAIVQTIDEDLTKMEAGQAVEMLYAGTDADRKDLIIHLARVTKDEQTEFSPPTSRSQLEN